MTTTGDVLEIMRVTGNTINIKVNLVVQVVQVEASEFTSCNYEHYEDVKAFYMLETYNNGNPTWREQTLMYIFLTLCPGQIQCLVVF